MRSSFLSLAGSRSPSIAFNHIAPIPISTPQSIFHLLRRPFHLRRAPPSRSTEPKCPMLRGSPLPNSTLLQIGTGATPGRLIIFRSSSSDFCSPKVAERLRLRDGMPKSYTLIYRSTFTNYLVGAQIAVFITLGSCITAGLTWLLLKVKSEDELQEKKRKQKEYFAERAREEAESKLGKAVVKVKEQFGWEEEQFPAKPELEDLIEEGPFEMAILSLALVSFAIAMFRIMRTLPVRIYMNNKKHCVGIHYGHVLPGKLTYHEFLAGSLRKLKKGRIEFLNTDSAYTDASGKRLILMEQFFRRPADYNELLGIQEDFMDEAVRQRMRQNPSKEKEGEH